LYIATNRPIIIKPLHPPRNPARDSPIRQPSQIWLRSRQALPFSRKRPLETRRILLAEHIAVFRRRGGRWRSQFFIAVVVPVEAIVRCLREDVVGENVFVP